MRRVEPEKLRKLITEIFIRKGVLKDEAAIVADALVDANITGRNSHGVLRTKTYVERLEAGGAKPAPDVRVIRETDTTALLDGDNGLGMVVAYRAAELTRKIAEKSGMACVTVKNCNHYGAAAYWTQMIARDDMIGFSCCNVEPLVAPPGGKDVALGTNPVCVYVPTETRGPVCLDIATSTVAQGKLLDYRLRHQELGEGWAVDADGVPTRDPDKAKYLTNFGAQKGYCIAVMIEIMSALLSGGGFGHAINGMYDDLDKPNNLSFCFIALKIDRFREVGEFRRDMDSFIDYLHSVPAAEGQRVYFPGEPELLYKAKVEEEGLFLPDNLTEQLLEIAVSLQIPRAEDYFTGASEP